MTTKHDSSLVPHIAQFIAQLTDNAAVITRAKDLQLALEQGHTAIKIETKLNDKLISQDGKSGYIVQKDGQAAFRRYYNMEKHIQSSFQNIKTSTIATQALSQAIANVKKWCQLTTTEAELTTDWQWQASLQALRQNRFVLDGGPGTGKTTTIIRFLLLYVQIQKNKKIALAAPTGKAANHMMQSINQQLKNIQCDETIKQQLSIPAKTLHRLLGYNHKTNHFKYNHNNRLDYDLVIIDESSMLDVTLAYALISALKNNAQLLLIGDKNQLPAVEAGNVFADLCSILTPQNLNPSNAYIKLTKNYRFDHQSLIAKLAQATLNNDLQQFKKLKNEKDFNWHNPPRASEKQKLLKQWYATIKPDETQMILCATNKGTNSVAEFNQLAKNIQHKQQEYSNNMPIIINKNDYNLEVYNGDIGQLQKHNKQWQVPFLIEGKQKFIQLQALSWEMAHAISIHKSQGSEYDHVCIVLAENIEHNLLSQALLYTAISRAKKTITLFSSEQNLQKTLENHQQRLTFLK